MKKVFSCFFGCLGIALFLFILGLFILALSGLIYVPFISKIVYKEDPRLPRGVYVSAPDMGKIALVGNQRGFWELEEGEFSYLLAQTNKNEYIKDIKANIFPDKIMTLIELNLKRKLYLTLILIPMNEKGDFIVQKAKLGYLDIPVGIVKGFLPNQGKVSFDFIPSGGEIKKIEMADRKIYFYFR